MFNSKYSNVLTIILVVIIIAIIVLVGFFGYNYWKESKDIEDAKSAVENFKGQTSEDEEKPNEDNNDEPTIEDPNGDNLNGEINSSPNTSGGTTNNSTTYKGYEMIGTIEIPSTNVSYPILSKNAYSKTALETSIVQLYGVNPNEKGNMVLVGHNFRSSKFFSNNKKLNIGDKIYITDLNRNTVTYTIYNKYETTSEDTAYMQRDTEGKREISLSTCTDDGKLRLILWASAD